MLSQQVAPVGALVSSLDPWGVVRMDLTYTHGLTLYGERSSGSDHREVGN